MPITGIIVSAGIAFGEALHLHHPKCCLDYRPIPKAQLGKELGQLAKALTLLQAQLCSSQAALAASCDNYQLIEADLLLLQDEELQAQIKAAITDLQLSAGVAVERIFTEHANALIALEDPYLANRAEDVLCLGERLIGAINGSLQAVAPLCRPTVLLAHDLTPAEFALLPKAFISGIVLKNGGLTCHTAILAKAAGIPALLQCDFDSAAIANGTPLALDAIAGELIINPTPVKL
ncbi:MAG: phosphoenolpyruvate-utilizing N-terminal domain-containing protein, partial [Shewanella sp.]